MAKKKGIRKPKAASTPDTEKVPIAKENPNEYRDKKPVWRFSRCDKDHPRWSITHDKVDKDLFDKLSVLESNTWREIDSHIRDGNTKHHFLAYDKLCKEAQDRLVELKLELHQENIYSISLSGRRRLIGWLDYKGVFHLIWRDDNHEVCPASKKNS